MLCGWLIATGTHWDIVQVFAWSQMWLRNVRTETAAAALAVTFSPEGMCGVCYVVQAARTQATDHAAELGTAEKAPLLPIVMRVLGLMPPVNVSTHRDQEVIARTAFRARPPVPPPRAA